MFSVDGLPDAGWVRLVKEIAHGYEYLDPKNKFASRYISIEN